MSALALAASTTLASAVTKISLNGSLCTVLTIRSDHGLLAAKDRASCSQIFGGGLIGSVKGEGKAAIFGIQNPASPGDQFVLTLSYPFVGGGTWKIYTTTDGQHLSLSQSGNYSVNAPAQRAKGLKSAFGR